MAFLGHELSLAALTVLDAGPALQIEAAADAGFDSVGLRLQPLLASDHVTIGDASAEKLVRARLRATGLGVLEIGVVTITEDLDIDRLLPLMAFSAGIGARFLVSPVADPHQVRRADTLAALSDTALAFALTPLVEFNPYSACRSLADAIVLVEQAGRGNCGLCIDAFHLSRSGGHPDDLKPVRKQLLKLLHLCDAADTAPGRRSKDEIRAESRGGRLLPGEGTLWIDELLSVLPAGIPVSVEAPSAALADQPAGRRAALALQATHRAIARSKPRAGA